MLTKHGHKGHLIFLSLVLLGIFCWIEVDLYAPAFPQLRQFFGTTEEMIQWTLSINFIGFFISSLFVGPLADSYGRRPVLLTGCLLFITGSLVCFLAPNLPILLAGRLLQGLGVSAPTTLALTVIGDLFEGDQQVKLFSILNSLVTLTMAAAPLMGAFLSERYGWRANFALILGGALASSLLVAFLVPESHPQGDRAPFSLGRMAENYGELLRSPFFLATALGLVLLATPYFIFIATIPFLFLETLAMPMSRYVYFQGVVVGLFAVLSLAVPWLVGKVDARKMTLGSITLSLAAGAAMLFHSIFLPDAALPITLLMCLFVAGIVWPCGCVFASIFEAFPHLRGSASALFSASRMLIMGCALAVSARVYDKSFRSVAGVMFLLIAAGFLLTLASQRRAGYQVGREGAGLH
jgi:MFS transporter, DHA1 family, multidrug resistance protein